MPVKAIKPSHAVALSMAARYGVNAKKFLTPFLDQLDPDIRNVSKILLNPKTGKHAKTKDVAQAEVLATPPLDVLGGGDVSPKSKGRAKPGKQRRFKQRGSV